MIKIGVLNFTSNNDNRVARIVQNLGYKVKKISSKNFKINMIEGLSIIIVLSDGIDDYTIIRNWIYTVTKQSDICIIITVKKEIELNQLDYVYTKIGVTQVFNENSESKKFDYVLKKCLDRARCKINYEKFELFKTNHTVLIKNKKLAYLTKLEFRLMGCLLDNSERIVEHSKLIEYVWNEDDCVTRTQLANLICRLREKIEDRDGEYIRTVHSKGYVLLKDKYSKK